MPTVTLSSVLHPLTGASKTMLFFDTRWEQEVKGPAWW